MTLQNKVGQELRKQTTKNYKGQFPNNQKKILYVILLILKVKMICKTLGGTLITL
jgi:hypothetical protein